MTPGFLILDTCMSFSYAPPLEGWLVRMGRDLEKRRFLRLEIPLDVKVDIISLEDPSKSFPPLVLKSRNISREGICLESGAIEVGGVNLISGSPRARENRLRMTIALPSDAPPLEVTGEPIWYDVEPEPGKTVYLIGVRFLSMQDKGAEILNGFLKRQGTGKSFFQKLFG